MKISDYLSPGQQNAVSLRRLTAMVGENPRIVRRMIESERRRGVPILSDNLRGYFLPATENERKRFVQSMRGRAMEILTTAAAVERADGLEQEIVEGW